MVIGCMAESFNNCPSAAIIYFNDFLQILLKNSETGNSGMNRNIAYALGILSQTTGVLMNPHLNTILALLNQLYASSDEQDAKDNIVAALCRIA